MSATGENTPPRHFMLPVDDTQETMNAFKWLVQWLYKPGDVVHLVRVISDERDLRDDLSWLGAVDAFINPERKLTEQAEAAIELLYKTMGAAVREAGVQYSIHLLRGSKKSAGIAEAITKKAEELDVEAIMVAHHKKSWVQTWLHGSVCREIMEHTSKPVMVFG